MTNPQARRDTDVLATKANAMLRLQDAGSLAGSLGKLLMGAGVCFAVGLLFASFMTGILYALFGSSGIGWSGWFLVYLIVIVPLLIWQERRSRENYLENAIDRVDPNPSSYGESRLNRISIWVGVVASWLVWGPRALIDGSRGIRGRHSMARQAVFERASLLVADLALSPGGVGIKQLLHPPEDMRAFGTAVDMLDTHGWIGKSSDGGSLWLSSTVRAKLASAIKTTSRS